MTLRNLAIWGVVLLALFGVWSLVTGNNGAAAGRAEPAIYSQLLTLPRTARSARQ